MFTGRTSLPETLAPEEAAFFFDAFWADEGHVAA